MSGFGQLLKNAGVGFGAFCAFALTHANASLVLIEQTEHMAPPGYQAFAEALVDEEFGLDAVLGDPLESENNFETPFYFLDDDNDTLTWDLPDGEVLIGFLVKAGKDVLIYAFTPDMLMNAGTVDFDITAIVEQFPGTSQALSNLRPVIGASEIPIPAAVWLMVAGLAGLGFAGRRKAS